MGEDHAGELTETMARMAADDDLFRRSGNAARQVVEANRGALAGTMEHLGPYLRRFGPATC